MTPVCQDVLYPGEYILPVLRIALLLCAKMRRCRKVEQTPQSLFGKGFGVS